MRLEDVFTFSNDTIEIDIKIKSLDLNEMQKHIDYFKDFENYSHFEIVENKDYLQLQIHFKQY